eukprot:29044_2
MIFKARASTVGGGGGGTRFATRGTRGGGGPQRGQSQEKIEVERVLSDLHDFRDASGFWISDWVLQVTVKQHDGKDDAEGEHVDTSRITKGPQFRLYSVDPDLLIRVTVKNLSSTRDISLMPVYVKDNGRRSLRTLLSSSLANILSCRIRCKKRQGRRRTVGPSRTARAKQCNCALLYRRVPFSEDCLRLLVVRVWSHKEGGSVGKTFSVAPTNHNLPATEVEE